MFCRMLDRAGAFILLLAVAAPVSAQCPDGTPPPCSAPRPPAPPDPHSLAVLYFRNATGDSGDASIADGLTEAIIARLGQIPRVSVKSGAVVARFRGRPDMDPANLGQQLHVANLVTGSLRRSGARLRITVYLTRAARGVVLWSDQYTRARDDLLGIEESISRSVAEGVVGSLLPEERRSLTTAPTRNGAAYEHFLRGNAYLAQRTLAATAGAISEFEAATREDTAFSEAFARIALAHDVFLDWGWPYRGLRADSVLGRGEAAAGRAMLLNPLSSDAWMAHGLMLARRLPRSYEGAVPALERAVALNPRNAEAQHQLGAVFWQLGRDSASIAASMRALQVEPGRAITLLQLALANWTSRRLDETRRWLDSTIGADPTFAYAYAFRAYFRGRAGDLRGARDDAESAVQVGGTNRLPGEAALVGVEALGGDSAAARARLATLPRLFVDTAHATFREGLFAASAGIAAGEDARALDILESVQTKGTALWSGLRLPVFDPIREQPRFRKLVQESRPPDR